MKRFCYAVYSGHWKHIPATSHTVNDNFGVFIDVLEMRTEKRIDFLCFLCETEIMLQKIIFFAKT